MVASESSRPGKVLGLSPREMEILGRLARGESAKVAAEELKISAHTLRTHLKRIFSKTRARSAMEAVHLFREAQRQASLNRLIAALQLLKGDATGQVPSEKLVTAYLITELSPQ